MGLGQVSSIPKPTSQDLEEPYGDNRSQPTGLDISPSGHQIGVLTYKDAYIFKRSAGASWLSTLNGRFTLVDLPQLMQTESGGFNRSGDAWFAASERLPAVLVETKL